MSSLSGDSKDSKEIKKGDLFCDRHPRSEGKRFLEFDEIETDEKGQEVAVLRVIDNRRKTKIKLKRLLSSKYKRVDASGIQEGNCLESK